MEITTRGRRTARAALGLVASLALGCGELTTRTWVTIDEEASGGYVEFGFPGSPPTAYPMTTLQGGFLVEVTLDTSDLPGPMHGEIRMTDVRIGGRVDGPIGWLCTFGDPEGFSGGPLVVDLLGGTAESSMYLDALAITLISDVLGLGLVDFEQEIDFDLGSAFDMVKFAEAFLSGSAEGLFDTESNIASTMSLLGIDAEFAMNTVVTNGTKPPSYSPNVWSYCSPHFATQGVGLSYVEILNVKSSYLRKSGADQPAAPTVISLADIGAGPGDVLHIETIGTYAPTLALRDGTETKLGAVFSATDEVLPATELFRIPGAIEAGADIATWPSIVCFFGICEDKGGDDILQDFRVDPQLTITVPAGAQYLVVAPIDGLRFYADNTGLGFGVRIDVVTP